MRIGLISDTHGLLRPEALAAMQGCDRIIHGGDIGGPEILQALRAVAPLSVVRGNNDTAAWADELPATLRMDACGVAIYALHNVAELDIDPRAAGVRAVISGHSHRPRIDEQDGVLFINPGSAGRRRFKLPISCAELRIDHGRIDARIIELCTTPG